MKYLVVLCDGMADEPFAALNHRTPMECAHKPCMDSLSKLSCCGTMVTVPPTLAPESSTANLAVMGYDPLIYAKGRSPLEAMSMGLSMSETDVAFRCNLVTLSDEGEYEDKIMIDHSAGEISTAEADQLIAALNDGLSTDFRHFYTGISYRHCLMWDNPPAENEGIYDFSRPHDHLGKPIRDLLPSGEIGIVYRELYRRSYDILKDHPVNVARRNAGKRPANSLWLWSPGKKPALPLFSDLFGLRGAVISAVDLIKGIGICAGMKSIDVEGATGTYETNYEGKMKAAVSAFEEGISFVYIHLEGPDECGHQGDAVHKVEAIERIDREILSPLKEYLDQTGDAYRILVCPDHPTPLSIRTHNRNAVPFLIYDNQNILPSPLDRFTEAEAEKTGLHIPRAYTLMKDRFLKV